MRRAIDRLVSVRRELTLQELRDIARLDPAWIGSRGVKKGPSIPVNRADRTLREGNNPLRLIAVIIRVIRQESKPTTFDSDDVVARDHRPFHDLFNAWIETGDIAPAREDSDPHSATNPPDG